MEEEEIAAYIQDVSNRERQHVGDHSQGDWFLRELARDRGYDGLPEVVTKEQMDQYIADGAPELFRGLDSYGMRGKTGEDLAEQFRSGELYVGTGLFGNGIYVAYGADKYDAEGYMGAEEEGAMLRLTLKPEAKTISVRELRGLQRNDPIVRANPEELANLGRYATFKGYDVINVGASSGQPKYMVILNRTAVRVQDESLKRVE